VHVSDTSSHSDLLRSLDTLYNSSPFMKKYVDIHLVYDPFDRQFNMWRNVAKFFARTDVRLVLCSVAVKGHLTYAPSHCSM
jgi:hypothetical protein